MKHVHVGTGIVRVAWVLVLGAVLVVGMAVGVSQGAPCQPRGFRISSRLPDLSGLAWLHDDVFIAVHDAKNPDELGRPRVSFLQLPSSLDGVLWKPMTVRFRGEKSSDLESASRIPGDDRFLLVESSDGNGPFQRIFLAKARRNRIHVLDAVEWSCFTSVDNVEATAVASDGDGGLLFVWAERNEGQTGTQIRWTDLTLDPFAIGSGPVSSVTFELPTCAFNAAGDAIYNRPVVGMDVGDDDRVYVVAAFDPSEFVAMPDNGPYRSMVLSIGSFNHGQLELDATPTVEGTMDGFKTESVAVRWLRGNLDVFIGTDDENYGGDLRLIPPLDVP